MTRRSLVSGTLALAIRQHRLLEAVHLLNEQVQSGNVSAAVLFVQNGKDEFSKAFGKASNSEAIFLLASITKPMTATAVMILAERKELTLDDPAQRFIPEFSGDGREKVIIRHLLTHTSGLPDMLPENEALRKRHAPLSDFVATTCRTPLLFTPGSEVRYQSMGILLAAEITQRITKQTLPEFLKREVYEPLGMRHTSLGLGGQPISSTMQSQVSPATDWDWNSTYWRNLASPWGGAFADAKDVARFLEYWRNPDGRILKPETTRMMITNQTGLPARWGLGWQINPGKFAKGTSESTFGHSGSTGTLCWCDPDKSLSFVLLTTNPMDQSGKTVIQPVSDLVGGAA